MLSGKKPGMESGLFLLHFNPLNHVYHKNRATRNLNVMKRDTIISMKQKLQLLTITAIIVGFANFSIAQNYVHQVIVLNEGQYDYGTGTQITPVSIGSYDVLTDIYTEFDVISGVNFGSDVLVDGDFIYVAADSLLLKYDKNSLTLTKSTTIEGIRKIAVWKDQILVTIGETVPHNAYFRVFDKNTLGFIYELNTVNGPAFSSEGVVVLNDTAYIAVSNSFEWGNYKGAIGLVDLNSQAYMAEVDIMPDGMNPDNLMISGTTLYTLNNKDWSSSSITEFNTLDRTFTTTNLSAPSGCGASVFADNRIIYHRYDNDMNWVDTNNTLNLFNITDQSVDTIYPNLFNVYGMVDDPINSQLYLTTTDFVSFGMAYRMDYSGTLIDSFAVGVSPGNLALDVRQVSSVNDMSSAGEFAVHPNPSSSILYIDTREVSGAYELLITDIAGRSVYSEVVNQPANSAIDIESWSNGVYMLFIDSNHGRTSHKIIKY